MACYSPMPGAPYGYPAPPPPPPAFDITQLIYPASNNALYARKGRLMVKMVSQQDGNYLRFGDDRGAYIGGNDILSNAGDANLLTINPTDGKITLTKATLIAAGFGTGSSGSVTPTPSTIVSGMTGNLLQTGSDGGAYISSATVWSAVQGNVQSYVQSAISGLTPGGTVATIVSNNAGNYLNAGTDGGAYLSQSQAWSAVQGNVTNAINAALAGITPGGGAVSPTQLISSDAGNGLTLGSDGKLFMALDAGEL